MDDDNKKALREKLEGFHEWPSLFMFKFIVPSKGDKLSRVKAIFGESVEFRERESSGGKFISLTVNEVMLDADSVFDRYERASAIGGVLSL